MWTVEWSHSEQSFLIRPYPNTITENLKAYVGNAKGDCILMAVTDSYEDAEKVIEMLEKVRPVRTEGQTG